MSAPSTVTHKWIVSLAAIASLLVVAIHSSDATTLDLCIAGIAGLAGYHVTKVN